MSEGYLEPVVVRVVGDIRDLIAKIKEAQALLDDFSKTVSTAHLSADYKMVTEAIAAADAELKGFAKQVFDAHLGATTGPLQSTIAAADTELKQWGSKVTNTQLGANSAVLQKDLLKINAELAKWGSKVTKTQLSADQTLLLGQLAKASTELSALAKKVTKLPVTADTKAALASAALAQQAINRMQADITVGANVAGAAAKVAALDAAIKAMNEAASGGGGAAATRSLGGLLTALGLGGLFGLAQAGSLAGLAGLGPERVLTTLAGLAGFIGAASAGAALIATAVVGVAGVGMATDMAGLGQAASDIKGLYADQTALNTAIGLYGPKSAQAAAAQKQYNYDLSQMPAVARKSIQGAVAAIEGFKVKFDLATGPAENIGAQIITQFVKAVDPLLPEIGKAALANMKIIQKALQPFFTWLDSVKPGGGIAVLTKIEDVFTRNLPNSMKALTAGFEDLANVIAYLAPMTGKITADLAKFFTSIGTPTPPPMPTMHPGESMKAYANAMKVWQTQVANSQYGLSNSAMSHINKWIADWHVLVTFVKAVIDAALAIDKASAGTGKSIFTTLTGMLDSFTKWANSKTGHAELNTLMTAHKNQLDAILKLLGSLIGAFGQLELAISPTVVNVITDVVKAFTALLHSKIPVGFGIKLGEFVATAGGIALLATRIGLLRNSLKLIFEVLTGKVTTLGGAWSILTGKGSANTQFSASVKVFAEAVAKFSGTSAASGAEGAAAGGGSSKSLIGFLRGAVLTVSIIGASIAAIAGLLGAAMNLSLKQMMSSLFNVQSWKNFFKGFNLGGPGDGNVKPLPKTPSPSSYTNVLTAVPTVPAGFKGSANQYLKDWMVGLADVRAGRAIPAALDKLLGPQGASELAAMSKLKGQALGNALIAGYSDTLEAPGSTDQTRRWANNTIKALYKQFGISSPSKVMMGIAAMNMQGYALGITSNAGLVQAAMMSVVDKTLKSLTAELPRFKSAGAGLTASLLAGAGSVPAFHGAGAGGGNIEITSHITFQLTGMPDMTHGSTFSRQLKSALDEHDRKLVQAIRAGRS